MSTGGEQGTLTRAIYAGTWSVLGLIVQKLISLGSFFVLARLLTPGDYGTITVVLMVAGVLDAVSTPGFERALIQKQGEVDRYLHPFWTFNVIRAFILAAVIFSVAPFIASFFNLTDPLALAVLRSAGLIIIIQSLGNMGNLFFFKELSFSKLFLRDVGGQLAFSLVAISYALYSPTVLSLFLGFLAQNITSTLVQYALHPHRPRLSLRFRRLSEITWYGGWVMAQNVLHQANSVLETVVVGRLLGAGSLGLYSRAVSIASLPSSSITSVVNKVGFPAYAKVQDSHEKVTGGLLKSFDVALVLMTPFVLAILFEGGRLVEIFLGNEWLPMVGPMKVLVLSFYFKGFVTLIHPLMEGMGKVDTRFKFSLLQSLLLFGLLFYFVPSLGMQGAALGALCTYLCISIITLFWAFGHLSLKLQSFFPSVLSIGGATLLTVLAGIPLYFYGVYMGTPAFLAYLVLLGVLYSASVFLFGKRYHSGPYETLQTILGSMRRP